jgi:hypothetical protein
VETTIAAGTVVRPDARRFYLWMAILFMLIAFGGFTPSYWARIGAGNFHPPPIMHIHGMFLFSWTLFYLAQTAWVASGRMPTHRAWGTAGIALFPLVICAIVILRLMYVLMSGLMIPALARVFLATLAPPGALEVGPPPPFVALPPACVAALLVVVAIVYDWRRGLRPHKAYVYGGLAIFLINFVAVFVASTQTWMQIARWLQSLGG